MLKIFNPYRLELDIIIKSEKLILKIPLKPEPHGMTLKRLLSDSLKEDGSMGRKRRNNRSIQVKE